MRGHRRPVPGAWLVGVLLLGSVGRPVDIVGGAAPGAVRLAQAALGGAPTLTPTIPGLSAPHPEAGRTPAVQPPEGRFVCPERGTLNCMPVVPPPQRPQCTPAYLDWVKAHCPGVQVVY